MHAGGFEFDSLEQAHAAMSELQRVHEIPYYDLYISKGPVWSFTFTARASTDELLVLHVAIVERVLVKHGGRPGGPALQESARQIAATDPAWAEQFISVDRGAIAGIFGNRDFPIAFEQLSRMVADRVDERRGELGVVPITFASPYGRHAVWWAITLPYDPATPGAREAVAHATKEAYELVVSLGGWCKPHQGEASRVVAAAWSPPYRSLVSAIKQAVDPLGILNSGLWKGNR